MNKINHPYKNIIPKIVFIIVLLISFSLNATAQNKKEKLQNQYNKIQKELKEIESLIKENKQERSNYLGQLNSIKTKINSRQN